MANQLIITKKEAIELLGLIQKSVTVDPSEKRSHLKLHDELKNALFLQSNEIPIHVVRLGCIVTIETDFSRKYKFQLVLPNEGDLNKNKLSVLSPMGAALIGKSVGEIVFWCQPNGDEKMIIEDVS